MGRKKTAKVVDFSTYSGYINDIDIKNKSKNKPNKETRKKALKQKKRRMRLSGKFIIFVFLLMAVICICLFAPVFNLKNIQIKYNGVENLEVAGEEGNGEQTVLQPYSNQEIIDMSQMTLGTNIFKINLKTVEENILKAPYIKSARITRGIPNSIIIDLQRRYISAYVDYIGSYMCIDETGYCVNSIQKENKMENVPILIGISPKDMVKGFNVGEILDIDDPIKIQKYSKLLDLVEKNELEIQMQTIDLSNVDNIVITIENGNKKIEFGSMENINAKMPFLKAILTDKVNIKGTIYIDKSNDPIFSEVIGG